MFSLRVTPIFVALSTLLFFFTINGLLPRVTLTAFIFEGSGSVTCVLLPVTITVPFNVGLAEDVIFIAGPPAIESLPVIDALPPGEFKSRTASPEISITDGVLLPVDASSTYALVKVVPAFTPTLPVVASIIGAVGFVVTLACEKCALLPSTVTSLKLSAEPAFSTLNRGPVKLSPLFMVAGPSVLIGGVLS